MFVIDITLMFLDALSSILGMPSRVLDYTVGRIKSTQGESKDLLVILFSVLWVISGVIAMIFIGTWLSRPSSPADLSARISVLEKENADLKASRDAAYRLIVAPSPSPSVYTLSATPTPAALTEADYLQTIEESKQEITELETELKQARAKPAEAERTPAEIEAELVRYREELKRVQAEFAKFKKENGRKVQ